ncbi:MAG: hypothetical protein KKH94_08935 [Candidatus Omnitrophica bacterium]|nr:hypothetical protein [Candidatus Omnitrophota bacterium]
MVPKKYIRLSIFFSAIVYLYLIYPASFFAEMIVLKDGSRIEGNIISKDDSGITIKMHYGEMFIPRKNLPGDVSIQEKPDTPKRARQALSEEKWSVTKAGTILQIGYGSRKHFAQYAALHLDSSYFRMNYGPDSGWGTSVVILPSLWTRGTYIQGGAVSCTWTVEGDYLSIDFTGQIATLKASGTIRISPPRRNMLIAKVNVSVDGDVPLDYHRGESFKPMFLSSMKISDTQWDTQQVWCGTKSFSIPREGWSNKMSRKGKHFGLKGGTSDWKKNAPTITIRLSKQMHIQGWVTKSDNPNHDNVGLWAASKDVQPAWSYTIVAKP